MNSTLLAFTTLSWPLCAAMLGLCIGSFLNVVIYRLPLMLQHQERNFIMHALQQFQPQLELNQQTTLPRYNLFLPRSHCPSCKKLIAFYDNVPLLSWFVLRRRCRHCHAVIAWRYPAVEAMMMVIAFFLACYFPIGSIWLFLVIFSALLITLAFIDFDCQLLPDNLTYLLLWAGLSWHCLHQRDFLPEAIVGVIAGYMSLWFIYWAGKLLTKREGLGYGDFKLLAALGAWFGWEKLPEILLIAALITLATQLPHYRGVQQRWQQPLPFGPGMAVAGFWMMIAKVIG